MTPEQAVSDAVFTIDGDRLVLTISPESLTVCPHCPSLHIVVLNTVSIETIRQLVIGLAHLAKHHLHDD